MTPIVGGIMSLGATLIDKLIPNPAEKAKAHLELLRMEQNGELEKIKAGLSAIIAEAQSNDPWTSRARPSFMYVMYTLILVSIPMGVLSAFHPDIAQRITAGMTGYLNAIPESLWWLFGSGYLGYTAARQYGKVRGTDR